MTAWITHFEQRLANHAFLIERNGQHSEYNEIHYKFVARLERAIAYLKLKRDCQD